MQLCNAEKASVMCFQLWVAFRSNIDADLTFFTARLFVGGIQSHQPNSLWLKGEQVLAVAMADDKNDSRVQNQDNVRRRNIARLHFHFVSVSKMQ